MEQDRSRINRVVQWARNLGQRFGLGNNNFETTNSIVPSPQTWEQGFQVETEKMKITLDRAFAVLRIVTPVMQPDLIQSLSWLDRLDQIENIFYQSQGIKIYSPSPAEDRLGIVRSAEAVSKIGVMLYESELIDKLRTYGLEIGVSTLTQESLDALEFLVAGSVNTPIGEYSLKDLISGRLSDTPTPVRFGFLARTLQLVEDGESGELYQRHNLPPFSEFPLISQAWTFKGINAIKSALNLGTHRIRVKGGLPRPLRGVDRFATLFTNTIDQVRKDSLQIVTDPSSPQFQEMKSVVTQVFSEGELIPPVAFICGHSISEIKEFYRTARNYSRQGIEVDFYQLLAATTKAVVEEVEGMGIKTKSDLELVLDGESQPVPETGLDTLKNKVASIIQNARDRAYVIDPTQIRWNGLIQPSEVSVAFDQNRPLRFWVNLNYRNPEGEMLDLELAIDVTKGTFEWPFLEAPDDPEVAVGFKALTSATNNILDHINQQAILKREQRQALQQPKEGPKQARRISSDRPLTGERERRPRASSQPLTPIQLALLEETGPPSTRIKKVVKVPEEEELIRLAKDLSSTDLQIAREQIPALNALGTWKLKRLTLRVDDVPVYSQRINCSVPGGMRILFVETESDQPGERQFAPIAIKYRKEIYRQHNL